MYGWAGKGGAAGGRKDDGGSCKNPGEKAYCLFLTIAIYLTGGVFKTPTNEESGVVSKCLTTNEGYKWDRAEPFRQKRGMESEDEKGNAEEAIEWKVLRN